MMGKNEIVPTPRPVDFEQEEQLEHYLGKLLSRARDCSLTAF
jgi:hypothetical protein